MSIAKINADSSFHVRIAISNWCGLSALSRVTERISGVGICIGADPTWAFVGESPQKYPSAARGIVPGLPPGDPAGGRGQEAST